MLKCAFRPTPLIIMGNYIKFGSRCSEYKFFELDANTLTPKNLSVFFDIISDQAFIGTQGNMQYHRLLLGLGFEEALSQVEQIYPYRRAI